jgi:hypothetical protein
MNNKYYAVIDTNVIVLLSFTHYAGSAGQCTYNNGSHSQASEWLPNGWDWERLNYRFR